MIKFIFGMQINIEVFYKLTQSFWVCVTTHYQSTQNEKLPYLCNISRKAWRMKLIFCLQINMKVFLELMLSLWMCIARHAQNIENSKFTIISLEHVKEIAEDEVDFLPTDKRKRFPETDTIIFSVCGQPSPNYPKQQVCYFFAISQERGKGLSWFFTCRKVWKLARNWCNDFCGIGQAFPKFPK